MARDHHFIGVRDVQVLAQQLADQIGIGVGGIEQIHPVAQGIALRGQRRDFGLVLRQHVRVLGQRQQHDQRKRLSQAFPG